MNPEATTTLMQEPLLQSSSFLSVDTQTTTTGTATTQEIQNLDVQPLTIDNQIGAYNPTDLITIQGLPPGTKLCAPDTQGEANGGYHEIGIVDGHSSINLLGNQIKGAYFDSLEPLGSVSLSVTIHDSLRGENSNHNGQEHGYSFSLNLINGHLDSIRGGGDGSHNDSSHLVTSNTSLSVVHDLVNEYNSGIHSNEGHNQSENHGSTHDQGDFERGSADQYAHIDTQNHKGNGAGYAVLNNDQPPVPEHPVVDQIHHDHSMPHS